MYDLTVILNVCLFYLIHLRSASYHSRFVSVYFQTILVFAHESLCWLLENTLKLVYGKPEINYSPRDSRDKLMQVNFYLRVILTGDFLRSWLRVS